MYGPVRSGPVRSNFPRTVTFWWNFKKSEILNRRCVKYLKSFGNTKLTHIMIVDIILTHFQHITKCFQLCLLKSEFYTRMFGSVRSVTVRSGPTFFLDLSNLVRTLLKSCHTTFPNIWNLDDMALHNIWYLHNLICPNIWNLHGMTHLIIQILYFPCIYIFCWIYIILCILQNIMILMIFDIINEY